MGNEDGLGVTTGQPNLCKQDLSKLDVSKLTALSPEVISRQATINIGTIGHVAHGKSTIVKAISGVQTVRFKNELERNITIKLDDADCSSSESADIPVNIISQTSVVIPKRYISPAGRLDAPSCAKMPKVYDARNHNNISRRLSDSTECSSSSSSLASLSSSSSTSSHQTIKCQQMLEVFDDSSSTCSGSTSTRNPSSDGRQSDYEELSSDSRLFTRRDIITPSLDHKMKEVRVQLYDVLRIEKYRKLLVPTPVTFNEKKMKNWEVEKILQKREHMGRTHYLVKWKNWDVNHNSWEPSQNLDCEDLMFEFEEERKELIIKFKTKTSYDPEDFHVHHFLTREYENNNKTIINAINDATIAIAGDSIYAAIRCYLKKSNEHNIELEEKIKQQIMFMLLLELRREQLKSLDEWEVEMNAITKGKPRIRVENLVDLENAPQDFYYIDEYLPGEGVSISDNPPIGCECKRKCGTSKKSDCCFTQNNDIVKSLPYTPDGRLRLKEGEPIYECNKLCACDITCSNRVVQLGTEAQLCIFRTDNGRGWGVRTLRSIEKGTFVIKYVGEVITSKEVEEKRGRDFDRTGCSYLFDLDYNRQPAPYIVDAVTYGNVSHFINHSCDPNLAVWVVWINCLEPDLPELALFATRDIMKNEELTFNYGTRKSRKNALKNGIACKCGTAKCRKFVF